MNKVLMTLLAAATVASTSVQAAGCCGNSCDYDYCCDPCMPSCCGSFEVGGEVIWFRPSGCDAGVCIRDNRTYDDMGGTAATVANALPVGKQCAADPDYDAGFRVMVGYVFDDGCSDVEVQYTRLHDHQSNTVVPNPNGASPDGSGALWATKGHPKFLDLPLFNGGVVTTLNQLDATCSGRLDYDYDAVDVQFASRSMKGCDLWVRAFVGLHWANVEEKTSLRYTGTTNPDQTEAATLDTTKFNKVSVWGVGPRLGVEARYDVFCGFGVGARLGVGIIAGETDGRTREDGTVTSGTVTTPVLQAINLDVNYCSRTHVIPELDARLGVNYTWCCNDCFSFIIEVGYEFMSYINALSRNTFNDQGATQNDNCYSFNLDGIYLMARLMF